MDSQPPPPRVATSALPPSDWCWTPPAFAYDVKSLPALPAVRNPALAKQAVTSKLFLNPDPWAGKSTNEHEIGSYRRLEFLGDGLLKYTIAKWLYDKFPECSSGILSLMRASLESNPTLAHLSYAYGLVNNLLEPPPLQPTSSLTRSLNINADLLEAHVGALCKEQRRDVAESWLKDTLDSQMASLSALARTLREKEEKNQLEGRAQKRKRLKRERETDAEEAVEAEPGLLLMECSTVHQFAQNPLVRWDDTQDATAGCWHAHMTIGTRHIGCGKASKKVSAREEAVTRAFSDLLEDPEAFSALRSARASTSTPTSSTAQKPEDSSSRDQ
ncbi:hypothetical protein JCM6882_005249 [Rhodosporidiobolus microsporus]